MSFPGIPGRFWRWLAGLVGLVCLLLLLRPDAPTPPPELPVLPPSRPAPLQSPEIPDLQLTRNITLRLQPQAELPPEPPPEPPETPVVPAAPPAPEPPPPAPQAPPPDSTAAPALAALVPETVTPEQPQPAPVDQPLEMFLRPRIYKHPSVPEKVIRKRKIDDSVLLQSRVGSDGRVHEVRVLRGIPNCDECTQSAVEAAEDFVYDSPVETGEVWTTPFEFLFSYKR